MREHADTGREQERNEATAVRQKAYEIDLGREGRRASEEGRKTESQ